MSVGFDVVARAFLTFAPAVLAHTFPAQCDDYAPLMVQLRRSEGSFYQATALKMQIVLYRTKRGTGASVLLSAPLRF
jgi:hypothetical protein